MINKVITHEMGHALKLAHPKESNDLHSFSGARGAYDISDVSTVYSIMHQGPSWDTSSTQRSKYLTSSIPQALDMINLISKWEHHQSCAH